MNVVLIDNDESLLRSLQILLSDQGHRVQSFTDPVAADFFLEQGIAVDVVIVDYSMPELNGEEVLRRIRGRLPESCRVILISGHTDLVEPLDLEGLGVHTFMPKPLDLDRLSWAVQ